MPREQATVATAWERARGGDFRAAATMARDALEKAGIRATPAVRLDAHLVVAFCSMRQGNLDEATAALDAAARVAAIGSLPKLSLRVDVWRAELAYFQGRYSTASRIVNRLVPLLQKASDQAYLAFALRIRIALLLARAEHGAIAAMSETATRVARASGDAYVLVQVLNVLGAAAFDRATTKLGEPHARAHLSALEPQDTQAMEEDAREALALFQEAGAVARRANYGFAAWYVAGNVERLQIILGHADRAVRDIRRRLRQLQARGATYDEIVARSNVAWALRTLGRHREALHELDVALDLVRRAGTYNVQLEFLHYDRSIVLGALDDAAGARASYRRYLALVRGGHGPRADARAPAIVAKRPLEPYFLKQADRFIAGHAGEPIDIGRLAEHCGVSWRTLQKAFADFRGTTAVAHVRNMRLDLAQQALSEGEQSVGDVARRCGFGSPTTFALEYRKRFGVPPSRTRRAAEP